MYTINFPAITPSAAHNFSVKTIEFKMAAVSVKRSISACTCKECVFCIMASLNNVRVKLRLPFRIVFFLSLFYLFCFIQTNATATLKKFVPHCCSVIEHLTSGKWLNSTQLDVGGEVALWLVRSSLDREVRVRSLAGDIALCSCSQCLSYLSV